MHDDSNTHLEQFHFFDIARCYYHPDRDFGCLLSYLRPYNSADGTKKGCLDPADPWDRAFLNFPLFGNAMGEGAGGFRIHQATGPLKCKVGENVQQPWGNIEGSRPQVTMYPRFTHLVKDALRSQFFSFSFGFKETRLGENYLKKECNKLLKAIPILDEHILNTMRAVASWLVSVLTFYNSCFFTYI